MQQDDIEQLVAWVEKYYRDIIRKTEIQGITFAYYKSLRGYFKHSTILPTIKEAEFTIVDFRIWERILSNMKSSRNPAESGGLFFRYDNYKDICCQRAYYKTRKKFIKLELLIKTPFKGYFVLNPRYVIKLYNPKLKKEKEDD